MYLVDFFGISYLENESKRVNLLIFVVLKFYWSKTHKIKSKYLIFTLPLKLFIVIIDHAESCIFLPILNPFFYYGNLPKVFNCPCTSQKTVCLYQNLFSPQNKGFNNPIQVLMHTKNNLRLFKRDSKTLLVCHSAVGSAK